jgi:CRP-like cAMP-binding protein
LTFFEGKSTESLLQCANAFGHELCRAGETFFTAGSYSNLLYILVKGSVTYYFDYRKDKATRIAIDDPDAMCYLKEVGTGTCGSVFGEVALLDDPVKPRPHTVLCREDCYFATLTKEEFRSLLRTRTHSSVSRHRC